MCDRSAVSSVFNDDDVVVSDTFLVHLLEEARLGLLVHVLHVILTA